MQREVKVEAWLPASWVDVSAYARIGDGISISRGRDSETGDEVAVGTITVSLDNRDGRFSPELASGAYYPTIVEQVLIRVSVKVSGTFRVRALGYVQKWGSSPAGSWALAVCTVTASDALGALPDYTMRQLSDELIRATYSPEVLVHHWPLRDSEGPARALAGSVTLTANAGTGWGAGGLLATDEGDQQHPLFNSASGGLTLTSGPLSVDPPYQILIVIMDAPGASCTILSGLPGGRQLRYVAGDGFDLYPDLIGGVETAYPCLVALTVTATTVALDVIDGTGYNDGWTPQSLSLGTLRRLVVNPTLSGGAAWGAGHLAVTQGGTWPYVNGPAPDLLRARDKIAPHAVGALLRFARAPFVVMSGLAYGDVVMPPLEGRDLADALGGIVKGMGARLWHNLSTGLAWTSFPPSGAPIALPAGIGDPQWGTDSTGWLSECTVTWADGTSYAASRTDGPTRSDSIEGVHPTRSGDMGYADWLVWSPTRARMPQITYNLSAMSDANVLTVLSVTIGARVSFPTLPAWIPAGLICIVEGIDESIDNDAWTVTLKFSPDVYSRLFILGDATAGVLDSTYLLAP